MKGGLKRAKYKWKRPCLIQTDPTRIVANPETGIWETTARLHGLRLAINLTTSSPRLRTDVPVSPRAADVLPVYNAGAMNLSRTARLLLSIVSGVALALAFPIFNFPFLAGVSLAVLILAVLNETPRYALLLGWVQGVAFYALSVPWFYSVMRHYGPLSVTAAGGVFMLIVFACAAFHAAFATIVSWFGRFHGICSAMRPREILRSCR